MPGRCMQGGQITLPRITRLRVATPDKSRALHNDTARFLAPVRTGVHSLLKSRVCIKHSRHAQLCAQSPVRPRRAASAPRRAPGGAAQQLARQVQGDQDLGTVIAQLRALSERARRRLRASQSSLEAMHVSYILHAPLSWGVVCALALPVTRVRKKIVPAAHGTHSTEESGRLGGVHGLQDPTLPRSTARPLLHCNHPDRVG